jgi:VWFA-related protein
MLRIIAFLLSLLGSAGAAHAQQPQTQADDPSEIAEPLLAKPMLLPLGQPQTTIMPTSDDREGLIHLDVAARDQLGRTFGDLKSTDLTLLQDGAAAKIVSFHRSSLSDFSEACLVLDEVDLSPVDLALVENETISFLRRNGGVLPQPVSILWVKADGVYRSRFPTTDGNSLAQDITSNHMFPTPWKFRRTRQPGISLRDTLWDEELRTVYAQAVKWRDQPGRKALIWMGYGWSIRGEFHAKGGPFPVLVELSTRIREARMVIYDITPWPDPEIPVIDKIPAIDYHRFLSGIRSSSNPTLKSPVPYFALPVLAVQSGGIVLDNSQSIAADIGRCIADVSDFYTTSFDPPHATQPDEYFDLAVLAGTSQLQMRTSHGYYNQPVFYDEPRVPEKRLDVAGLKQFLESDPGGHDLAGKLRGMQLTERLASGQLADWKEHLHAKESNAALTALGDESVFLAPPSSEVPGQPPPDDAMQSRITERAQKYLDAVVPMLPDFSADAATVKYEQPSPGPKDTWKAALPNRALLQTMSERTTLLYRNGREQRVQEKVAGKRVAGRNELSTTGIFGPILRIVLDEVRRGNSRLNWARWEQTGQGTLAVFYYSVGAENPRYSVVYCCLVDGSRIEIRLGHHGELAVDPDTGAILRITVESEPGWIRETDLSPVRPVPFSNMMVEYGPVEIGGRTFTCPKRSVAITRERTVRPVSFWGLDFKVYGPYQTLLNDTAYGNYHKFGSESHMLPGFEVMPDGKTPAPEKDNPQPRNQP